MSYIAKIFNVMIASPSDVEAERTIIRNTLYEWNSVNSNDKKIVLIPVGWESHSSPEMGANAQTIINAQVLTQCDLLVGVFWGRIGTETEDYLSGTVEEIEKHIIQGKPTMLYFSNKPISPNELNMEQLSKLRAFKDSCKTRGLYEEYTSNQDFKEKFYRQLQLKVNNHKLFQQESNSLLSNIVESSEKIPNLSDKAQLIIKTVSNDPQGTLIMIKTFDGTTIQTNGVTLLHSNVRRDVASWESAVNELMNKGMLIQRGYKGEIYEITDKGYSIADMISN